MFTCIHVISANTVFIKQYSYSSVTNMSIVSSFWYIVFEVKIIFVIFC